MRNLLILMIISLAILSGCAPVVVAGVGAAGVGAREENQIYEDVKHGYNVTYFSSLSVLSSKGIITAHDKAQGKIFGRIDEGENSYDVMIEVKELEDNRARVYVKVRKNLIPNIELANQVLENIVAKVKE